MKAYHAAFPPSKTKPQTAADGLLEAATTDPHKKTTSKNNQQDPLNLLQVHAYSTSATPVPHD